MNFTEFLVILVAVTIANCVSHLSMQWYSMRIFSPKNLTRPRIRSMSDAELRASILDEFAMRRLAEKDQVRRVEMIQDMIDKGQIEEPKPFTHLRSCGHNHVA